jgi:hypothetical protein
MINPFGARLGLNIPRVKDYFPAQGNAALSLAFRAELAHLPNP